MRPEGVAKLIENIRVIGYSVGRKYSDGALKEAAHLEPLAFQRSYFSYELCIPTTEISKTHFITEAIHTSSAAIRESV
jgi:hypothetical protein